jgi:hypothetical protein
MCLVFIMMMQHHHSIMRTHQHEARLHAGTLRKKSESGIFGTHLQKMQNSQIP